MRHERGKNKRGGEGIKGGGEERTEEGTNEREGRANKYKHMKISLKSQEKNTPSLPSNLIKICVIF